MNNTAQSNTFEINALRRLRILQTLDFVAPNPMGELALLDNLRTDAELSPTIERVRQSVSWLHAHALVEMLTVANANWVAAQITEPGKNFLTDTKMRIEGLFRPEEKPRTTADKNRNGRTALVDLLPADVKSWLDQELIKKNFTRYQQIADLLAEKGYAITKQSLWRYGRKFKKEQQQLKQSIEMAKAFAEVVGDDGAAMNQTLTVLAQQELLGIVRNKQYDDEIKLPDLVRAIASLNRSDINTRKFQIEQAARQKALDDAARQAEKSLASTGIGKDTIAAIKNDILGLE